MAFEIPTVIVLKKTLLIKDLQSFSGCGMYLIPVQILLQRTNLLIFGGMFY